MGTCVYIYIFAYLQSSSEEVYAEPRVVCLYDGASWRMMWSMQTNANIVHVDAKVYTETCVYKFV